MTEKRFADTYALMEIAYGSPHYAKYKDAHLVTSVFHLAEFFYSLLRLYGERAARAYFTIWRRRMEVVTDTALQEAMRYRLQRKRDDLSYADCVGYAMAKELGIPFLTGDRKFEGIENVEYVE